MRDNQRLGVTGGLLVLEFPPHCYGLRWAFHRHDPPLMFFFRLPMLPVARNSSDLGASSGKCGYGARFISTASVGHGDGLSQLGMKGLG